LALRVGKKPNVLDRAVASQHGIQRFGYWRSWGIQGTNVQSSTNFD